MKDVNNAVAYALLLPELMKAGREVGYALAVHGSMNRDLDIVAIPWTEEAVSADRLVLHILAAVDGRMVNGGKKVKDAEGKDVWETVNAAEPSVKPHGRLAWSIHIGHKGLYIDISVMPRALKTDTVSKKSGTQ